MCMCVGMCIVLCVCQCRSRKVTLIHPPQSHPFKAHIKQRIAHTSCCSLSSTLSPSLSLSLRHTHSLFATIQSPKDVLHCIDGMSWNFRSSRRSRIGWLDCCTRDNELQGQEDSRNAKGAYGCKRMYWANGQGNACSQGVTMLPFFPNDFSPISVGVDAMYV